MKEFDFDELDKAVNSLMADAKVKGEANSEPEVAPEDKPVLELTPSKEKPEVLLEPATTTLENASAPDEPSEPSISEEDATPEVSTVSTLPAEPEDKPATVPRRSGRFMDVVHPSSDMRPSLRTHSEAVVAPISANVAPQEAAVTTETTKTVQPDEEEPSPVFDPIAFEENKKTDEEDVTEPADLSSNVSSDEPATVMSDLDLSLTKSEASTPDTETAGSPFLTDAKVEKRPLNSEAMTPPEADEEATVEVEEKDSDIPVEPQPAELGSEILAIESGTATVESTAEDKSAPSYKGVTTTPAPVTAAPVSISQQYREQPSSTPEDHQAMYDSAAHPALAHPAKKRSGWWIVLWVILLLALGAGGAAALYMLKMI